MWFIVSALLGALLIGLIVVGLIGVSLWRSGKALMREAGALLERGTQALDELNSLQNGLSANPSEPVGRTMNEGIQRRR